MRKLFYSLSFALMISCSTIKFIGNPTTTTLIDYNKKEPLVEYEKKFWHLMDPLMDSVAGMSVDRAYEELIKNQKGEKIIVAVIDSGVDIDHSDLQGAIWTNEGELPNNLIDDDKNGYIDDIHGWNFLGDCELENMESVRLQKKETQGSDVFEKFEKDRQKNIQGKKEELISIQGMIQKYQESDSIIKVVMAKEKYSLIEVENYTPKTFALMEALIFRRFLNENKLTMSKLEMYLKGAQNSIDYHYEIDFDGRAIVGDDPENINDRSYGNGNVIGPEKDGASHGTHVTGIIASGRNNKKGNRGVFDQAKVMVLRAVPDGDEYDKDIALAIRYAVDNGAKVINTSFGKGYSPHKEWVWDALKYAEKKDVLIVNAAGNSGANVDPGNKKTYITDEVDGKEIVSNFINVGAINNSFNKDQVASFSNFGSVNVDVFAPGSNIWSSVPQEKYDFYSGTSMAAPNTSGVAAAIRSFFPKLKAHQVKSVLMNSGVPLYPTLKNPKTGELVSPKTLSVSGKAVNLYNALIYCSNKSYKK